MFRFFRVDWADISNPSLRGIGQALVNEAQEPDDDQNDSDDGFAGQLRLQNCSPNRAGCHRVHSDSTEQVSDQAEKEKHQEDDEENLGDPRGRDGYAGEAENGRNDRDDEET